MEIDDNKGSATARPSFLDKQGQVLEINFCFYLLCFLFASDRASAHLSRRLKFKKIAPSFWLVT